MTRNDVNILTVVYLIVACGCSGPEGGTHDADSAAVARTEVERGPVRVSVEVAPQPARLADEPTLTLTIDYERGVKIEETPFGEALGDFIIRDFREPLPQTRGEREIIRQVYTLEPTRAGKLQIDPITISFRDDRPSGSGARYSVETETLSIDVATVLASEVPSLDALQPAAGPLELPEPQTAGWWWAAALVVVGLAVGVVAWHMRRRNDAPERPLSPQQQACLELEELMREGLGLADVKRFYVRLTGIVRRYIERTTGVRAPEQTTEEFLREIGCGSIFSRDERERLKDFLEVADLVKYAAHQPREEDIEESYERARAFIGVAPRELAA